MTRFSTALTLVLALFAATLFARQTSAPSQPAVVSSPSPPKEVSEAVAACLACHSDPDMTMTFTDGSTMSLHVDLAAHFQGSVHASQLTCTDCHTSHQVQHPGTTRFRLSSPERCITCHGNEPLMAKYGISTNVAKTYLADFHGATASLSRNLSDDEQQIVVTCSACHGVHDIASPTLLGADVMKATVEQTCASCHQDAGVSFPAAWISHYPPSLRHAPLVFAVESFYRFFIPFAVLGLILNLGLHVYRMSAGR